MAASTLSSLPGTSSLMRLWKAHQSNTFLRNLSAMGSAQLIMRAVRLASTVFISRLLLPEDYGLAAIVLTVYELVALFTRNGISAQVVQAADDEVGAVANMAHRLTWVICLILMVLQTLAAWPVAWLYGKPDLALPIAAMSLIYLATPLSSVQSSFQSRESRLGRIAMAGVAQTITDNALTILFCVLGFGLWAIILPKILVAPIWVYFVRYGHAWRPGRISADEPAADWRKILRFSRNVMGVELLSTLQSNVDNALVGYFLGVQALGLYYFAFNAGLGISLGMIFAAGAAVYPHFCEVRDNRKQLLKRLSTTRWTLAKTFLPLILLQASLAPIYVPIVFGARWVDAIPVLSIICLSALMRPFANATSEFLKAVGRPDIEFRWQLVNTAVLLSALLVAAQFNIIAVAVTVFVFQTVLLGVFALFAPQLALRGRKSDVRSYPGLEVVVVREDEGMARLASEWNALWLRASGSLASQSYAYCDVAWKVRKADGRNQLLVFTLREHGKLVAVWPLLRERLGAFTKISALNSGGTEYDSLLVDPAIDASSAVNVLHNALREHAHADILHVPFVAEGSAADAATHRLGWLSSCETLAAPYVALRQQGSFDEYWKSLSSNLRNGAKRRLRRLEEQGTVSMKFETASEARREAIAWALQMKADWMKRKHMDNDFINAEQFRAFLLAYERHSSIHEGLSVLTLRLDGKIIACKIGTFNPRSFEGFITVYDAAHESHSPGALLLQKNLQWCAETGRDYDFRIGDEPYKANWANGCGQRTSYVQALTLKGAAYMVLAPVLKSMKRALVRIWKFLRLVVVQPSQAVERIKRLSLRIIGSRGIATRGAI